MSYERRKIRVGRVVGDKMDKTVVVQVEWRRRHRLYRKSLKRRTRFKAHDEQNLCKVGDLVRIVEARPLSKSKHWRVKDILAREEIAEVQPEEITADAEAELAAVLEPEVAATEADEVMAAEAVGEVAIEEHEEVAVEAEATTAEPEDIPVVAEAPTPEDVDQRTTEDEPGEEATQVEETPRSEIETSPDVNEAPSEPVETEEVEASGTGPDAAYEEAPEAEEKTGGKDEE